MDFSKIVVSSVKERLDQSSLVRACLLVSLTILVACGAPESPEEVTTTNGQTETVPPETVVAAAEETADTPTSEKTASTPPSQELPATPESDPETKSEPKLEIKKPTVQANKTPDVPAEKTIADAAPQPAVEFPEMEISEKQSQVRALFIQANNQFNEQRYVGAIQTLRKLDSMDLHENEELALDMFLKRIEKALSGDTEPADDAKKEASKE